jgi:hypothetical protein
MLRSDTLDTALSKSRPEQFETNTARISKLSVTVQHCRLGDNKFSGNIIATLHAINVTVSDRYIYSLYINTFTHVSSHISEYIHKYIRIYTYIYTCNSIVYKVEKTSREDVPAEIVENIRLKERISDIRNFKFSTGFWENIFTETFCKQ